MRCTVCGAGADADDCFCRVCGRRFAAHTPAVQAAARPECALPPHAERRLKTPVILKTLSAAVLAFALLLSVLAQVAPNLVQLASLTPVDLGVTWTEQDYVNAVRKCDVLCDDPPDSEDRSQYEVLYTGSRDVDWSFTESEVTALLNGGKQPGWWPASRIQLLIHGDNVLEISCLADPEKLITYPAVRRNLPQEVINYVSGIPRMPVHAKMQVRFTGAKQADITLLSMTVSGISVAGAMPGEQANSILKNVLDSLLQEAGPVRIDSFTTAEGSMRLKGTWFRKLERKPIK